MIIGDSDRDSSALNSAVNRALPVTPSSRFVIDVSLAGPKKNFLSGF